MALKDDKKVNLKDDFIQELIELWTDLNYSDSFASQANFNAGGIWNNSMIRIAGKTIFYKHWVNAGAMKINDMLTSDSRIISYSCFKDKFCFPVSFLEFCGVTSAIRSAKRYLKLTLPGEKIQVNVLLKLNSSVSLRNIFIFIKAIEHFCRVNIASSKHSSNMENSQKFCKP